MVKIRDERKLKILKMELTSLKISKKQTEKKIDRIKKEIEQLEGSFSKINVDCPNCGEQVEFKSKDEGSTGNYDICDLPREIVEGILGEHKKCSCCNYLIEIEDGFRKENDYSMLVF